MSFFVKFRNQFIWLGISLLIVLAIFIGKNRSQQSQLQLIESNFSGSSFTVNQVNQNKWIVTDLKKQKESLIYLGEGFGYNGLIKVLVKVDKDSLIQQIIPASYQETPSYFKKIIAKHFLEQFVGKNISRFLSNQPIDVISGATITSNAIKEATKNGYIKAEDIFVSSEKYPIFGILEFTILYLLIAGLVIAKSKNQKIKMILKWISVFISLILLGFIYNQPISYSRLSALLLGNFPSLNREFYFYILLFGSIIIVLISNKNIYCHSVCPFGAAQEILAKTGKAKVFRPTYYKKLKFIQRTIALTVILLALALNNPVIASYEVFSAFFQLTANFILFGVLFIVIVLSLFIKRPWCHFMCPIDSVFEYLKLTRKSITGFWKK